MLALVAAAGLAWQAVAPGVWRAETPMARRGPLATVRAVVLRLDPARVRFELKIATRDHGLRPAWTVDSLPDDGLAGFNAGQFADAAPWGWLVREGREEQAARAGSLTMSLVVDGEGHVSLVDAGERPTIRTQARLAFQSYPAILVGKGELPFELRGRGRGADLDHRDSRLAIGILADGTLLVALTRFTGLGRAGEQLPWGPTVVEMADWMRSQGCQRAMLLDGGISGQMAVRGHDGNLVKWRNLRPVPLGMIVFPGARPAR